MKAVTICLGLVLTLLFGGSRIVAAAEPGRLIAIDVLLLPDAAMTGRARAINDRLKRDYPAGFVLDATHTPHITLLQCYVRRVDLNTAIDAVERVFRASSPVGMELEAAGLFNGPLGPVNATGISVHTTPALADLQQAVVAALTPLTQHGGSSDAFVDAPKSETIGWTVTYVDRFVERSSGEYYAPHVTAGIAPPDLVAKLVGEKFAAFRFQIKGAAIYQLGDIGTARKRLWASTP